ncbi:FMN-dependent NADH-azoreductase [Pseudomonas edaphica]|uniref:FMN dependent NADH:quinone oxidoreductase n=1 Tax=Pseudomonas edaphica TaxID=2006980 RepID=A0ABY2UBZ2_9PSED|nr:NAD(P)H-dependent oxidoreductase [Pseudomonas edaphica]TLG93891.1 FMN-dependent NADH-azoreductase [Pseudomonas edaphica]
MKKMLVVHASPRGERSHSRRLAESFLEAWQAANPGAQLTRREVGRAAIPHVSEAFVAANFYPEPQSLPKVMKADLQLSDQLVGELIEHELLVISMPLYNFGVPSGLKAWIDQIVRMGLTFDITLDNHGNAQYQALLKGKRALIITSRGGNGFGPGGENEAMNHADPHLRTVLGYIGIDDIQVIAAEGEESDKSVFLRACEEAERQLHDLAGNF